MTNIHAFLSFRGQPAARADARTMAETGSTGFSRLVGLDEEKAGSDFSIAELERMADVSDEDTGAPVSDLHRLLRTWSERSPQAGDEDGAFHPEQVDDEREISSDEASTSDTSLADPDLLDPAREPPTGDAGISVPAAPPVPTTATARHEARSETAMRGEAPGARSEPRSTYPATPPLAVEPTVTDDPPPRRDSAIRSDSSTFERTALRGEAALSGIGAASLHSAPAPLQTTPASLVLAAMGREWSPDAQPVEKTSALPADRLAQNTPLTTLRIQLQPIELGSVTARLTLSGAELMVEIEVETAEARHRLAADSDQIVKSLRGLGFEVDRVQIHQSSAVNQPDQADMERQRTDANDRGTGEHNDRPNTRRDGGSGGDQARSDGDGDPDHARDGVYI